MRGDGATLDGVPLDPTLPRAPRPRRAPRGARHRVGRPALGRASRSTRSPPRTGCARSARSRSRCARSRRRASTRWPRCKRCRAVDAAAAQLIVREARRGRSPRWTWSSTCSRGPQRDRRAQRGDAGRPGRASCADPGPGDGRCHPGVMVDWTLATRLAGTIAGEPPPPPARQRPRRADRGQPRARARLHAAWSRRRRCPPPRRSTAGVDRGQPVRRSRPPRAASEKLREGTAGMGPLAGPAQTAASACSRSRSARSPASSPHRVLGQYEFPVLEPDDASRGCCSSRPTSTPPWASSRRPPRAAALGRAARGHARAAVRRRAVAARAPGRPGARAARRPRRVRRLPRAR